MTERGVHLTLTGDVQAVGFREWAEDEPAALGVSGWIRNRPDGSVEIVITGEGDAVAEMAARCRGGPPAALVNHIEKTDYSGPPVERFTIQPDG